MSFGRRINVATVVGVRFKKAGKIYYFDPVNTEVKKDDYAIVETARGVEYGEVVTNRKEVEDADLVSPLKPVIRKATDADAVKVEENHIKEKDAFNICSKKIKAHNLEMNLVEVEYTFDVSKIIFYFTAEGRIDFRELVKDLAAIFRTRIELRQIGVRDEAKMLGGIGCCGRPLCCSTFLGDFEPVSIRMAKDQNLSLNPTKISGICGRLLCCLKYENYLYCDKKKGCGCAQNKERQLIPKPGMMVVTPTGEGRVMGINRSEKTASVELAPDNTITVGWDEMIEAAKVEK
jgi:cell fate regulator YaaT (PSP1 superfamily)